MYIFSSYVYVYLLLTIIKCLEFGYISNIIIAFLTRVKLLPTENVGLSYREIARCVDPIATAITYMSGVE